MDSVYFYVGHGTDKCDSRGELVIKTVPDNCIYVTLATCGLSTYHDFHQLNFITDEAYANGFKDPVQYKKAIAVLLGIGEEDLHIHLPGDTYVDNRFYPVSNWKEGTKIKLSLSGIISNKNAGTITDPSIFKMNSYDTKVPIAEFLKYFPGRPSGNLVKTKLSGRGFVDNDDIENLSHELGRDASEIMSKLPGVHYNMVCRNVSGCTEKSISERRSISVSREKGREKKPTTTLSAMTREQSELRTAIQNNDIKSIKSLLASGVDPAVEDSTGNSALDYAKQRRSDIYQLLLQSFRKGGRMRRTYRSKKLRRITRRKKQ